MKALLLSLSLLLFLFINAQNPGDTTKSALVFTDTQHVYIDEEGRHYKMNFTYDSAPDTEEEPFIEEYFMVFVCIGLLFLYGLYHFLKNKDKKEEFAAEEIYTSKYFGDINKTAAEEFYETNADIYEKKVELTVNVVSEKSISHENIERIEDYIDHLIINEAKLKRLIDEDFRQNGETKNYISLLMEDPEHKEFVDSIKKGEYFTKEEYLLSSLYLLRINFFPEKSEKVFAVFDYTIDEGLTDDLLVVVMFKDNKINITIES